MSEFVRVAGRAELPERGESIEIRVHGRPVCLANIDGAFSAVGNLCAHMGAPLSAGAIDEGRLVCPWHGWRFDPATGKSDQNPGCGVPVYEVKIDGDDVMVKL